MTMIQGFMDRLDALPQESRVSDILMETLQIDVFVERTQVPDYTEIVKPFLEKFKDEK